MPIQAYYPPLSDKADPTKEIRKTANYLRKLIQELQVKFESLPAILLTRADADKKYSGAALRKLLQSGGTYYLNVQDLPGVLAQPQNAGVPTGTVTPSLLSPLSQNGALFIITPGVSLQFFDGSSSPGTWKAVTATAIGHNVLSATHLDTLVAAVVRGDLIVGNSTPLWSRLGLGAGGTYLRSNATDALWSALLASDLSGTVVVANGGSGAGSFTAHGVLLGEGASAFGVTAVGATGTVLRGNSGADPTFSGSLNLSGTVTNYNNIATVSDGVPAEYAAVDLTAQTANIAATTLYAVPSSGAGMYRVSAYVVETTAGSLSSTLPNVQILYTDNDTGGVVTIDATPILGVAGIGQTGALTANTVGTASSGVIVINAKASTNIQYQTINYASNLAGMAYALHLKLEAL